jgi:hypothetical protein
MVSSAFGLGIDFGTSSTVAMLRWPDGRVKSLLFEGSPLLPSAVFAPAHGPLIVGSDALHHGRFEPSQLEPNPKRLIDDEGLLLGDREVSVVELFTAVLKHVAAEAARVTGGALPTTALACPAGWGSVRRGALIDAAEAAGLGEITLVPEPVAAADYFTRVLNRDVPLGQALVVYDLGAGTFDTSAVRRVASGFEVAAVDGLTDIGGLDLDAAIVTWLRNGPAAGHDEQWNRLENPSTSDDRRERRMLWDDVRVAKEMLSRAPAVLVRLPSLNLEIQFTRDEFEATAQPLLGRTVRTTGALIRYAKLGHHDLAGLLLVGGASRVPLVATLLHRTLDVAPVATEQPELIVAEGALQSVKRAPRRTPAQGPSPVDGAAPVSAAPVSDGSDYGNPGAPVSPSAYTAAAGPVSGMGFASPVQNPVGSWAAVPTAPHRTVPDRAQGEEVPTGTVYTSGNVLRSPEPLAPVNRDDRVIPVWDVAEAPRPAATPVPTESSTGSLNRRPGRHSVKTVVAAGIAIWIVIAAVVILVNLPGGSTKARVPDLAGASQADAATRLKAAGLRMGEVSHEVSTTVADNMIIRTDPPANRKVSSDTPVKLVLARQVDPKVMVVVPNVANKNHNDAIAILTSAELTPGEVIREKSDSVTNGTVIRTEPTADSQVPKGTSVKIVLATNDPTSSPTVRTCTVPDVVSQPQVDAESVLKKANLTYNVKKELSTSVQKGTVIRTDPGAGRYDRCGTVTVYVSLGGPCQDGPPNVLGLTEADAKAKMAESGCKVGVIYDKYCPPPIKAEVVTAQRPSPGGTFIITIPRRKDVCPSSSP